METIDEKAKKVATIIQTARVQKGMSQEELGEQCGMKQNGISRIEKGLYLPTLKTLLRISEVLKIPININNEEV